MEPLVSYGARTRARSHRKLKRSLRCSEVGRKACRGWRNRTRCHQSKRLDPTGASIYQALESNQSHIIWFRGGRWSYEDYLVHAWFPSLLYVLDEKDDDYMGRHGLRAWPQMSQMLCGKLRSSFSNTGSLNHRNSKKVLCRNTNFVQYRRPSK